MSYRLPPYHKYNVFHALTGERKVVEAVNEEMAVILAADANGELSFTESSIACGLWVCVYPLTWEWSEEL